MTEVKNDNATTNAPNNLEQCDMTGFRQYPEDMVPDGYGNLVRKKSYESRHPMDVFKARGGDKQRGSVSPEQSDIFIGTDIDTVTIDDL